jgi:hypothetical protein
MKSRRCNRIIYMVCTLVLLWSALPQQAVRADIGWPPLNPSGAAPGVPQGVDTQVRMVSEEVVLTVETYERPVPKGMEASPAYFMRGLVEAQFLMRNLGESQESFDVWFPLAASVRYHGLLPVIFPDNIVQDFKVWVDGLPVSFEQEQAPDVGDPKVESSWARFPMTFPAGQDVQVHVNYTIYPSGRRPFGDFEYILQTGAGWKGTIGEATIIVNLPDTVTPENVSLSGNSVEGLPLAPNPAGYTIENNEIRWHLTDLEPTEKDNVFVNVLESGRYRSLVHARATVLNTPNSADAQLALANAIQNALIVVKRVGQHGGGKALGEQVNVAYRRALELAPQRAEIYYQYATWLLRSDGSNSLMRDGTCPQELCDVVRRGLEIAPDDPELVKLDEQLRNMQEEHSQSATQWAFAQTATAEDIAAQQTIQALSATPTPMPTQTPLPSLTASATLAPATSTPVPASPTATSAPKNPGVVCKGMLLPLGLGAVVLLLSWLRRRALGQFS